MTPRHAARRARRLRLRPTALLPAGSLLALLLGASLGAAALDSPPPERPPAAAAPTPSPIPVPVPTPVPLVIPECTDALTKAGAIVAEQAKYLAEHRAALLTLSNGDWPGEHVAAMDTRDGQLEAARNAFYEAEKICAEARP